MWIKGKPSGKTLNTTHPMTPTHSDGVLLKNCLRSKNKSLKCRLSLEIFHIQIWFSIHGCILECMGLHCLKQCFGGFYGSKSIRLIPRPKFCQENISLYNVISVNHSISQWFQRRLVYVFDWFHVNLLNLNVFRQLLVRFMDFITLHLTTVSVPWLLHWFYNFCILHSYLINHQNKLCLH